MPSATHFLRFHNSGQCVYQPGKVRKFGHISKCQGLVMEFLKNLARSWKLTAVCVTVMEIIFTFYQSLKNRSFGCSDSEHLSRSVKKKETVHNCCFYRSQSISQIPSTTLLTPISLCILVLVIISAQLESMLDRLEVPSAEARQAMSSLFSGNETENVLSYTLIAGSSGFKGSMA